MPVVPKVLVAHLKAPTHLEMILKAAEAIAKIIGGDSNGMLYYLVHVLMLGMIGANFIFFAMAPRHS